MVHLIISVECTSMMDIPTDRQNWDSVYRASVASCGKKTSTYYWPVWSWGCVSHKTLGSDRRRLIVTSSASSLTSLLILSVTSQRCCCCCFVLTKNDLGIVSLCDDSYKSRSIAVSVLVMCSGNWWRVNWLPGVPGPFYSQQSWKSLTPASGCPLSLSQ